jgi:hypothetical protein
MNRSFARFFVSRRTTTVETHILSALSLFSFGVSENELPQVFFVCLTFVGLKRCFPLLSHWENKNLKKCWLHGESRVMAC